MAAISALKVENWSLFHEAQNQSHYQTKRKQKKRESEEMERRKRLKKRIFTVLIFT